METGAKETASTSTSTSPPSSSTQTFPQLPQDPQLSQESLPQTSSLPQVSPPNSSGNSSQIPLPSFESVIGDTTYSSNNVGGGYDATMATNNAVGGYDGSMDAYLSNLGDVGDVASQNVGLNIPTYQNATQGVVDPHQISFTHPPLPSFINPRVEPSGEVLMGNTPHLPFAMEHYSTPSQPGGGYSHQAESNNPLSPQRVTRSMNLRQMAESILSSAAITAHPLSAEVLSLFSIMRAYRFHMEMAQQLRLVLYQRRRFLRSRPQAREHMSAAHGSHLQQAIILLQRMLSTQQSVTQGLSPEHQMVVYQEMLRHPY